MHSEALCKSDVFKNVASDVFQYVVRTIPPAVVVFFVTMTETTCRGENYFDLEF